MKEKRMKTGKMIGWSFTLLSMAILIGSAAIGQTGSGGGGPASQIKVSEALGLLQGLRNLDGRQVISKGPSGQETVVLVPWEFKSGSLRLAIADNIAYLTKVEEATEKARQGIVKEIVKGQPEGAQIAPGSKEMEEFIKQYNDVLSQPSVGTAGLTKIKAADLKLDVNEIGVTTLTALRPIIEK